MIRSHHIIIYLVSFSLFGFVFLVALMVALIDEEVDVEFVATRSQEGHMVKVVAGNCM